MDDLISRAAAIAQIKENYCDWCDHTDLCKSCETYDCIATIEQHVPVVDAAPVVHGRWTEKETSENTIDEWQSAKCTNCGKYHTTPYLYYFSDYNFCPNCGAKMDGDA